MLKQLANVQVWVRDQDEALAFYTEKLGMEVREDVTVPELGNFRWLASASRGSQTSPSS
jgi:catechol 2,3-dioxygenase-like lactoylglutathione lyase family enzyme